MITRYTLPKMGQIWQDEIKFSHMLKIELLACEAQSKLKLIPRKMLDKIKKKAKFDLERIKELEAVTQHDVVAFIANLAENLGPEAKYLHIGLTSNDLLDTTLALQMKEASEILLDDLNKLSALLAKKAKEYKNTLCVARTHGVHAEPTTFGLKMALWFDETQRNTKRMQEAKEVISVGKISGAVGNYAHLNPSVEKYVCEKMGLKPANISTQVIQRDRHAQFLTTIALIGSSLEKFATEIRHLQKTEVLEVEEPFGRGQKGSSAMPHKRNPINCERICGMARILRANAQAAMENINLWHERDISHSSVERIIIPDSTIALDYMINKFTQILDGLIVYPKNMILNLATTKGLVYSQRVLLELMKKGLTRTEAYDIVQKAAMQAWDEGSDFKQVLLRDRRLRRYLNEDDLVGLFNVKYYTRYVDTIFNRLGL
jgi:adenylosuccinate lyase